MQNIFIFYDFFISHVVMEILSFEDQFETRFQSPISLQNPTFRVSGIHSKLIYFSDKEHSSKNYTVIPLNIPAAFNLLQHNFFQPFTTQLLLTFYNTISSTVVFYNPAASNPLKPSCFKRLQNFYNSTASELFHLSCFQSFTTQPLPTFYNPAASNL